jgi:hypothetical protein
MNLRTLLQSSVDLETLRKERDEAQDLHLQRAAIVRACEQALEAAERRARESRRRWIDLGVQVNEMEKQALDSVESGNSR